MGTHKPVKRKARTSQQTLDTKQATCSKRRPHSLDRRKTGGRFDALLSLSDTEEGYADDKPSLQGKNSKVIDLEATPDLEQLLTEV